MKSCTFSVRYVSGPEPECVSSELEISSGGAGGTAPQALMDSFLKVLGKIGVDIKEKKCEECFQQLDVESQAAAIEELSMKALGGHFNQVKCVSQGPCCVYSMVGIGVGGVGFWGSQSC